jgi:mannosyltransferase
MTSSLDTTVAVPGRIRRTATGTSVGSVVAIGAVVVAAIAVRTTAIGSSLWTDEAVTSAFTQRGFGEMLHLFTREPNGLLYQFVVYPLAQLSGAEWVLRLPSVLAGLLAVPALYWAGRELGQRRGALFGAAILALSPLAVHYSKDARPYAFVMLFAALSFGALARGARTGEARWSWLYAATLIGLAYSNAIAVVLVLVPHVVLISRFPRSAQRSWLLAGAGALVASIPMGVMLSRDRSRRNPLYWLNAHRPADFVRVERLFLGGNILLVVIEVAIVIAAFVYAVSRPGGANSVDSRIVVIALWAFGPPVVGFMISQFSSVLAARFLIVALPGTCLLVGVALERMPAAVGSAALALVLAVSFAIVATENWIHSPADEEWRAAMRSLAAERQPGDPTVFLNGEAVAPASAYVAAFAGPGGRIVIPEWDHQLPDGVTAYQQPGAYFELPSLRTFDAATMRTLVARTGRVFLVARNRLVPSPGLAWARHRCHVEEHRFTKVRYAIVTDCR